MESKNDIDLSQGHLTEGETALYVDSLLNNDISNLPPEILSHVEICTECKDKILDVFLYLRNSQSSSKPKIAEPLFLKEKQWEQKTPFYISRIAASFFILALIVFIYFSFVKKDIQQQLDSSKKNQIYSTKLSNKTKNQSKVDSTNLTWKNKSKSVLSKKIKQVKDPNFKINPNLEYMINSQSRNISIQIISPKNNSSFEKEIKFSWEPSNSKNLQIKILDNKNNVLWQYSVKKDEFLLKEKLSPGLYYWKLENQSDLLYVGKFYIIKAPTSPPK
jgi:hypothetical protein